MLEARRGKAKRPSLVVMPKSLVWNWGQEAARFTPHLRVLAHVGSDARRDGGGARRRRSRAHDLRDDARRHRAAAAGRVRHGDPRRGSGDQERRVRIGEGGAPAARRSASRAVGHARREPHRRAVVAVRVPEPRPARRGERVRRRDEARTTEAPRPSRCLSRALRPFILRRTKEVVAPELPPKHEETILCELDPPQRKLYDELRDHYRASLLGRSTSDAGDPRQIEDPRARGAAAPAPGLVSPRPHKSAWRMRSMRLTTRQIGSRAACSPIKPRQSAS